MNMEALPDAVLAISGRARVAGVIGWPISHSLSPYLHNYWLRKYRIDGVYVPLAIRPQDLDDVITALPKLGLCGLNVTLPHKERTLELVDRATPAARHIGAVNTVVVADGTVIGSNTDAFGFIENLRQGCAGWSPENGPAVVLGAGGAARAVAFALLQEHAPEVRIVNRSIARAEAVADRLGPAVRVVPWSERALVLSGAALLVNTTTLGMEGQPPLDIDLAGLPQSAVVTDIVYVPLETPLLAMARARGNAVIDGLGMLLHQARPGFAAWFGQMPEVTTELRSHVLRYARLR